MSAMLESEYRAAQREELGRDFTREWMRIMTDRLDIEMRDKKGKRPWVTEEEKRKSTTSRWHRWMERVKQDPQAYAAYLAGRGAARRQRRAEGGAA